MGADKIKLNFINRSNDTNNSSIVIFQTNVTQDLGELAVAWRVIENCMPGDNHPFVYPNEVQIGAEDSYGNFTPRYDVEPGEKWHMVQTQSGFELQLAGQPAGNATEFELANDLQQGAIDACVYRDGLLTAREPNIAPGMKAAFDFRPVLYMSVSARIVQGDAMTAGLISEHATEVNLVGIASADIVLTGGGSGETAKPFVFALENVVYA